MDKLGRVIETNSNGEVRKHIGHKGRTVYFVWATDAKAAISFSTLADARATLGIVTAPSERAMRARGERHAADEARKAYVTTRNANHKGRSGSK